MNAAPRPGETPGNGPPAGRFKPAARTYTRPMRGWWTRNPYFIRYMLREGSALFVTGYALVLLLGLNRLGQGPVAWDAWRAMLATPWSIGLHVVALGFVVLHSVTWFQVMPKTAPDLPLPPRWITAAGLATALLVSVALFGWLAWRGA